MEIDTNWISEFEDTDQYYDKFYRCPIQQIKLFILYVNRDNTLVHIKKQKQKITKNILEKERLIELLKENMNYKNKEYRPISILKYNIDISPENVKDFIVDTEKYNFLNTQQNIENIRWNDTIELFHDINSLYLIFYEKWKSLHKGTRKIYIKKRKKLKHRKTKRKALKDKQEI